jgi:hypothetical protein
LNRLLGVRLSGTVVAAALLLSGCTSMGPTGVISSSPNAAGSPSPKPRCATFSPATQGGEVQAKSGEITVFGQFQGPGELPIRSSDQVSKVVWRMTGKGDLKIKIQSPSGKYESVAWGPEPHGSSSYDRPGDEWGTGIAFNLPGCWKLDLIRSVRGTATIWLDVLPAGTP